MCATQRVAQETYTYWPLFVGGWGGGGKEEGANSVRHAWPYRPTNLFWYIVWMEPLMTDNTHKRLPIFQDYSLVDIVHVPSKWTSP